MTLLTSAAAEHAFYQSFQQLDLQAMGALWTDGEEATCVHPGGPLIQGKEAVIQSWAEIFASADPPGIEYRLISRQASGVLAVHLVEERIRPSRSAAGPASRIISTNVYLRASNAWRMVVHHASLPLMPGRDERARTGLH